MVIDSQYAGVSRVIRTQTPPYEDTFGESLYEWMHRAPWLAISLAGHLVLFLIIQAVPWSLFTPREEVVIVVTVDPLPLELEEPPPPPEVEPEVVPAQITDDPVIQELSTEELSDTLDDLSEFAPVTTTDLLEPSPFDNVGFSGELGLGGPPGGKYSGRFGPGRGSGPRGKSTAPQVQAGLSWLARHQDADGSWDCDGFMKHDPPGDRCTGTGGSLNDVGVTGLALLAFLGDGHTSRTGSFQGVVKRGIRWLREQQDHDRGLIGDDLGKAFLYGHAIASTALTEDYYFTRSPRVRMAAQRAIHFISRARNPYGAWGYDYPPSNQNDTSVTGWMVIALQSAREAGLVTDPDAFTGALMWLDEVTDEANGRVGYRERGSRSARETGVNDHFPVEKGETLTAVGLLSRVFLDQDPREHSIMSRHADLMLRCLPRWEPDEAGCDVYYWYYGSYAMYQMGGRHWKSWNKAMKPAVVDSQRKDGTSRGSWDPVGPWGMKGGRVYSTAMMVLCLEVYYRYARIVGAR